MDRLVKHEMERTGRFKIEVEVCPTGIYKTLTSLKADGNRSKIFEKSGIKTYGALNEEENLVDLNGATTE